MPQERSQSVVSSCLRRKDTGRIFFFFFVNFPSFAFLFLLVCFFFLRQRIENRSNCASCYFYISRLFLSKHGSFTGSHWTGRARRTSPCDVIIVSRIRVKFVVLRGKIAFKIASLRDVGWSGSFGAYVYVVSCLKRCRIFINECVFCCE